MKTESIDGLNAILGGGTSRGGVPSSVHGLAMQVAETFLSEARQQLVTPKHLREVGAGYLPELAPDAGVDWIRDAVWRSYEHHDGYTTCADILRTGGSQAAELLRFARDLEAVESRNAARLSTLFWALSLFDGDDTVAELAQDFLGGVIARWRQQVDRWKELSEGWSKAHPGGAYWAKPRGHMALAACRHLEVLPKAWRLAMATASYDPHSATADEGNEQRRGSRRRRGFG